MFFFSFFVTWLAYNIIHHKNDCTSSCGFYTVQTLSLFNRRDATSRAGVLYSI